TQKPRKPKRKDTQVPQPSDPSEHVTDKAVHKELGDSLVRAATTASSLEEEQDSGNITKTRSKATPNESSSLGTTSGGGPRCQETMGDIIAQTSFENVSKHSNDSLLARGNTLQSDEDRLKLDELMKLRVKKLERKDRSRTHKLKRLYKVGLTARVESSRDEESLVEDASKQRRRINAIDADEDITLVNSQDDVDNEMFDVNALNVSTAATTAIITTEEITLAQALEALKTSKPKVKGIVFQEPGKSTTTTTTIIYSLQSQDKGKGIMAKIKADNELAQRLQAEEQEELFVEEKEKLFQQLLEQRRNHFAAKSAKEKRNKPPTQAQQRKIMCTYLKNMEGKKPQDLKNKYFDSIYKMFDRAFKMVNTFVYFRTDLVEGSSKRAGEELEQERTKKQKVDEDKDTTELQSLMEVIPDEKEVAIDVSTFLEDAVYADLHAGRKEISPYTSYNYRYAEQEASGRIVGIKSLLNAVSITAAHIRVNAAQLFNAAEGVNAASEEVSTAELVSTAYLKEFDILKWDQQGRSGTEGPAKTLLLRVERTGLRLFQFSLRDQASNWLERFPAGSITTWEDLTTRFLAQFFPPRRTAKLRNDILMFQQHHGKSLTKAWTRFKDLLQKVPHHGIDLWLHVQIFYDHVNPITRRTIDQSASGKLRDQNAKESWALLEDLALYYIESWNNPRDFVDMIRKINLLWKTVSEKLNDVSTPKNARNSMAPKSIVAISRVEREELRKKGIKSPSKLFSLKYLSPASIKELNKNSSAPKRVHFVNSIVLLSKDSDTEEDVSSTNVCRHDLSKMMKGNEEVKDQGKEEDEMETDVEEK
ncbi:retrovirus-related pol polyprotein from transposon TNT 1-94, partial [Tanacetum coccineum]